MLVSVLPLLREQRLTPEHSRFVLEPLEPGFGHTLGHALRRALIATSGLAVTRLELSGWSGSDEELSDLVLATKELSLSGEPDSGVLRAESSQPGLLTAAELEPGGFVVSNPDLVLTGVSAGEHVTLSLTVERGAGYRPAPLPEPGARVLEIDAQFSPVLRADLTVSATRVGQRTDFDSLVLEVVTRPSTSPRHELDRAAGSLLEVASLLSALNPAAEGLELNAPLGDDGEVEVTLDELELSVRTRNSLQRAGVYTLRTLGSLSTETLRSLSGLGERSLEEIAAVLNDRAVEASPAASSERSLPPSAG